MLAVEYVYTSIARGLASYSGWFFCNYSGNSGLGTQGGLNLQLGQTPSRLPGAGLQLAAGHQLGPRPGLQLPQPQQTSIQLSQHSTSVTVTSSQSQLAGGGLHLGLPLGQQGGGLRLGKLQFTACIERWHAYRGSRDMIINFGCYDV